MSDFKELKYFEGRNDDKCKTVKTMKKQQAKWSKETLWIISMQNSKIPEKQESKLSKETLWNVSFLGVRFQLDCKLKFEPRANVM